MRFLALDAAISPRFASRPRRSCRVRPAESLLTRCKVCGSVASRASTMTLRTPSCSMNAIACYSAPAPMESIATTAATPKIIPSIVSRARSLWERRLSRPSRSSSATLATPLPPPRGGLVIADTIPSSGWRLRPAPSRTFGHLGVHERDFRALGEALDHDATFVGVKNRHRPGFEPSSGSHVDHATPLVIEERLSRYVEDATPL